MSVLLAPDLPDAMAVHLRIALTLHEAAAGDMADRELRDLLVDAYNARGIALAAKGNLAAALTCFEAGVETNPRHPTVLSNRANILHMLGRTQAALASNDQALAADPQHVDALFNRGLIVFELGRTEEGLACLDRVLALQPEHAQAMGNRGTMLSVLGRFDEAVICFQRAQALLPNDPTLRVNEALARLALGDYVEGWKRYEARWGTGLHPIKRRFQQPQWRGEDVPVGSTILLHAEQGFGDTLQFCRYAPLVARRARVVLEVPAPLRRLMATLSDDIEVITEGEPLPPFDLHCPLLSLPFAFGTTLETIPANIPYLRADRRSATSWRKRLAGLPGLKVGLVWAGDSGRALIETRARDRRRSVPLAQCAPLGALSHISLVSLQKGPAAADAAQPPSGLTIHDWTNELSDFADTAALIAGLDLVISVDTAVAHLAGALGKPIWVLNRHDACWRWLRDRTDSPWYSTARLFRQTRPGDWDTVIAEVASALGEFSPQAPKRQPRRRKVQ
jgi:Flp pilus assembly protein TadD